LFSDGIFHIPSQTFTAGFDKTKVFTARIPRVFPVKRDAALEADINRRLFESPLQNGDVGRYLKMRLARSIAGCYRDKKFVCCVGEADSSKGTITQAMRSAFGGYVVEWNANHLKYNSHSGADEAKKLSWVFPIKNARLAISNECRMDQVSIDGNLLKTLSSGGDVISARQNFHDETDIILRASFMYMGNDMPDITPKDSGIKTRVRVVRFTKRFVENPVLPNEMPADPTIKDRLITEEWQNAVFWLIMDAYGGNTGEPAEVVEETKEWIPQDLNKFREVLEEEFVLNPGDDSNDNFVAAKDIIAYIKGKSLNMSDTKIGRELGKLGLKSSDKKIGGKTLKVWFGIKNC
jgi:phage/plasmid-associated DNA primase